MSPGMARRVTALDWMRGWVMVLMTVDHASMFFNAGRVSDDSAATYRLGAALPLGQFLLRWVTHLCAPTFLFLAGTALHLSVARRRAAGVSEAVIDRDLLLRGGLIVALDLTYMSFLAQHLILQVLYAIGLSMVLMAVLRRVPPMGLLALALAWLALGELVTAAVWKPPADASVLGALTVARATGGAVFIVYPVVPWLAIMMLGWVFGGVLERHGAREASRTLVRWGLGALVVFAVVRGADGYGNMWLHRADGSLQEWLHVSKYPPSLSFFALEIGLMALCIAALMRLAATAAVGRNGPLLVFGQTALFFYLAHFTLLGVGGRALGIARGGMGTAFAATAVTLVALYPVCLWFRAVKQARPGGWVRFI